MKNSLRKSFINRRRKKYVDNNDSDHEYQRTDGYEYTNSNLNLVQPIKSKKKLGRDRRGSSSLSSFPLPARANTSTANDTKTLKLFAPRYDNQFNDNDTNTENVFDRFTHQIRKSFRRTFARSRTRLESANSNKPSLDLPVSIGLTSPIVFTDENKNKIISPKRKKAPLAPTHVNQTLEISIDTNLPQVHDNSSFSNIQNKTSSNGIGSFRKHLPFLTKESKEKDQDNYLPTTNNCDQKRTFSQRLISLRRSFQTRNRNSSKKSKLHLLTDE